MKTCNLRYFLPLIFERVNGVTNLLSGLSHGHLDRTRLEDLDEIRVFLQSRTSETIASARKSKARESDCFLVIEIYTRKWWDHEDQHKHYCIDHDSSSSPICVIIFEDELEEVVNGHTIIVIFDNHALILTHRFGKIERCEFYYHPSVSMIVSRAVHQARLVIECHDEVKGHEEQNRKSNSLVVFSIIDHQDDYCVLDSSKIQFSKDSFYCLTTNFLIKSPRIHNVEIYEYIEESLSIIIYFKTDARDESSQFNIVLFGGKNDYFNDEDIWGSPLCVLKRFDIITVEINDNCERLIKVGFEVVATMFICPTMDIDDNSEQVLNLFMTDLLELNKYRFSSWEVGR